MTDADWLPMFPLGSVLLPSAVLPLHVFEPRYRMLVHECLLGDREFGVALIERGSEVGGGDTRVDVATVARIVEAEQLDDGRWAVIAVGTRRVRVRRWLDDDPYPRAEVEDWPEGEPAESLDEPYEDLVRRMRVVLGLAAELGEPVPDATTEVSEDPSVGSYQVAHLAPIGAFDRQRVLASDGAAERVATVGELLEDLEQTYRARLLLD